jgi:hypothetical protein
VSESSEGVTAAEEPRIRDSHLSIEAEPMTFPDDDALCARVRRFDHVLGVIEQAFVFALLALVVSVAALAAIHDKLTTERSSSATSRWIWCRAGSRRAAA